MKTKNTFAISVLLFIASVVQAQCPAGLSLQKQWEIPFTFPKQAMTVEHDQNGKPYIYVAAKEQGVLIYDISGSAPVQVKQFTVSNLANLEPMSLSQTGNYVYVALGNTFGNSSDAPGMAIIDVSTPANATLTDTWVLGSSGNGAGIVKVEGNYAYLGAMGQGLIILDIGNKSNIGFVSQFKPVISFPNPNSPDPAKYNARGMAVRNSIVYLCYDAGGIRIIDASNKSTPKETGRYANSLLLNRPRAYNNVVLDDTLLYVAVDYCGLEILNVKDTANITRTGWWNPWHCESSSNTWFNSGGHTNEIAYNKNCRLVFMSSGRSEVNVVSVANPAQPDSCTKFTTTGSNQGSWGIGLYQGQVYAAYIFVPLGIPFPSSWGGVKMMTWNSNCMSGTGAEIKPVLQCVVTPNPSAGVFSVRFSDGNSRQSHVSVFDLNGRKVFESNFTDAEMEMDLSQLPHGYYNLQMETEAGVFRKKLLKNF